MKLNVFSTGASAKNTVRKVMIEKTVFDFWEKTVSSRKLTAINKKNWKNCLCNYSQFFHCFHAEKIYRHSTFKLVKNENRNRNL